MMLKVTAAYVSCRFYLSTLKLFARKNKMVENLLYSILLDVTVHLDKKSTNLVEAMFVSLVKTIYFVQCNR